MAPAAACRKNLYKTEWARPYFAAKPLVQRGVLFMLDRFAKRGPGRGRRVLIQNAAAAGNPARRGDAAGRPEYRNRAGWPPQARPAGGPQPYAAQWLRRWIKPLSCLLGLCLALYLAGMEQNFARSCDAVRGDTLRLHIRAASDGVADQTAKLRVRDAVLELTGRLYAGAKSADEAKQIAARCLPQIALCASHTLWQQGCRQPVRVFLTNMYFLTSVYDEYTLPPGYYDALRIEIGGGYGQNWWCCLYPQICLAACSGYAAPGEQQLVVGDYELRFRLVEWWRGLAGPGPAGEAAPQGVVYTLGTPEE